MPIKNRENLKNAETSKEQPESSIPKDSQTRAKFAETLRTAPKAERLQRLAESNKEVPHVPGLKEWYAKHYDSWKKNADRYEAVFNNKLVKLIPIIPGLARAGLEQGKAGIALATGINPETGQPFESLQQQVTEAAKHYGKCVLNNGEAALDALIIFATAGTGEVAEIAAKQAAEEGVEQVAKQASQGVLREQLAKIFGKDGEVELVKSLAKGAKKIAEGTELESHASDVHRIIEAAANHPPTKKLLKEAIRQTPGLNEYLKRGQQQWTQTESFRQAA